MFREEDIKLAFHNWVTGVTSLEAVWQNQTAPRPTKPYASMKITSSALTESTSENIVAPIAGSPAIIFKQEEIEGGVISIQIYAATETDTSVWDTVKLLKKSVKNPLTKYNYFQAKQTDKVVINTVANLTVYTVTIYGVDISITSDADATDVEIRDALIIAINDNPYIWNVSASTISGETDSFLVSGVSAGQTYSIAVTAEMSIVRQTYALDIALVDSVAITDLTTLNDPAWEPRVSFDLRYNYSSSFETDLSAIEEVSATGAVGDETVNLEVP
jgi:hypothetical protein